MPWSTTTVSERRTALIHAVRTAHVPLARACRDFGVSRKTAYKWLARYDTHPDQPLDDHSRRPLTCPTRTPSDQEATVLEVRDRFGWGPRKIVAYLRAQGRLAPPVRTAAAILARHHRITPPTPVPAADQRFERPEPNQLWQVDFKGFIWVGRQKVYPLTILDDHSRYLVGAQPCRDQTMATAWAVLWRLFADVGLPDAILCDNAFGAHTTGVPTLSWFDGQRLRLGIRPIHGRPYHPQTQGKVERFHGTLVRELWPTIRRDTLEHFTDDLATWRTTVYNAVRPHEALGDRPPVSRWCPSRRPCPPTVPEVVYPAGATLRRVTCHGDIGWRSARLLIGRGLAGQKVQVEPTDQELILRYAGHEIRRVPLALLGSGGKL